jgi:hypothetical protein
MDLNAILSKTDKGQEEIDTRKYKLDMRTRALLIMVNGKSSATDIQHKFGQMGDVTAKLEQLVAQGFVAATRGASSAQAGGPAPAAGKGGGADFEGVRAALSRAMSDALGPAGDGITVKLEACESMQELKDYIDTRRGSLEAALGRRGDLFWRKAKELLG